MKQLFPIMNDSLCLGEKSKDEILRFQTDWAPAQVVKDRA